jgi:DNA-binding transcriptional regulator YiaG
VTISGHGGAVRSIAASSHLFLPKFRQFIDNRVYQLIQDGMSPNQILAIRESLKLTQQQLADRIGAQRHTIARWESGVNEPKGAYLKALTELAVKTRPKKKR